MDGNTCDIAIIGGGPAGVVAATQAAKAGLQTTLIEKGSTLGGTTTVGGVNFPGLFHAWGQQVVRGYGWQLVERCVNACGDTLPDFSTTPDHHAQHQILVNRFVYAMLCDEAVINAGCDLKLHTMPAAIQRQDNHWKLTLCGKAGLYPLNARYIIDCTGDANGVALAGGELRISKDEHQPGTQVCRVSGFDFDALDFDVINRNLAEAVKRGEVKPHDIGWSDSEPKIEGWLRKRGENANHVPGIHAGDSDGRTRIELAGRAAVLRVFRFLKQQPGLEQLQIDYLAPECGVRETAVIVGEVTVTAEDYCSGRVWDDALCHSFYPIDLHTATGSGLDKRELKPGTVPSVPLRALLPRGLDNIAAAGRCVSSDREANSALRVQASAMAMGQAAAAACVVALKSSEDLRRIDIAGVKELLRAHDAIVPGDA